MDNWQFTKPENIELVTNSVEVGKYPLLILGSLTMTQLFVFNTDTGKHEGQNSCYAYSIDEKYIYGYTIYGSTCNKCQFDRNDWYVERIDLDDLLTEDEITILKIK
tara:strand:- start:528 stop:845 length:318 start_codon:yes stop_codon:yes gene_type:complete